MKYRPDIDGLRAISIACVIGFHAFPQSFPGGFIGVDIFFVISGFLITSIIFSDLKRGNFSFLEFYTRRIFRILPALLLVLFTCIALSWILLLPNEYQSLGRHLIAASTFTSNLLLWFESGYFDSINDLKPLLHLWSLGIEEQFYIVWPCALYFLYKLRINLWMGLGLVVVGSFCLNVYCSKVGAPLAFYFPLMRFWELGIGGLAALVVDSKIYHHSESRHHFFQFTSVIGCILVAIGLCVINKNSNFPGWLAILPVLGAFMLILGGPTGLINHYVLSNSLLVYVGLISYPLYLWHWPLLSFYRIVAGSHVQINLVLIILALSIFLATLTRSVFEVRILRYQITFRLLLVLLVMVGVAGLVMSSLNIVNKSNTLESYDKKNQYSMGCSDFFKKFNISFIPNRDFCAFNESPLTVDIIVLGDSHANDIFSGLKEISPNKRILNLGRQTCSPVVTFEQYINDGKQSLECQPFMTQIIEYALLSNADEIYIGSFFSRYFKEVNGEKITIKGGVYQSFKKTFDLLGKSKKSIKIVMDIPILPFSPSECLKRPFSNKRDLLCTFDRSQHDYLTQDYRKLFWQLADKHKNIKIIDPTNIFCDSLSCGAVDAIGFLLYRDYNHLSKAGAVMLATYITQQ